MRRVFADPFYACHEARGIVEVLTHDRHFAQEGSSVLF
jgi:hypothetical protein